MNNPNDRYNLILLQYKERKTLGDRRRIRKLCKRYPDNSTYERELINLLSSRGLVEYVNSEAEQDEFGDFVYINDLPKYYQTTQAGETALRGGLFPSDMAKEAGDNRFKTFQIIGIAIAALGGLATLLSFLYQLIKHLVK